MNRRFWGLAAAFALTGCATPRAAQPTPTAAGPRSTASAQPTEPAPTAAGSGFTEAVQETEPTRTADATAPTEFLRQLTGEWAYDAEVMVAPEQPLQRLRGTERSRVVGTWVLFETDGETPTGRFTGLLTLGFDSQKHRYVGTWVSSVADALVVYDGSLDATGKVLTLDALGMTPRFRDVIELHADGKVFRSMVEVDGKWVTFATHRHRRAR